ncbi:hypothetical protein BN948_01743 [Hydrogenophaga intermedia]|uniref:Uncharacterized protein n=1 Tax=Hydrogenophaga intermedia TaxID=65786 RepID=A0A1L1PH60_HYDIT|nr:hypothetical protein [Hydrogenophaga intermedia]CDN87323.1 hypothetical protein BN948_01743 [Hydrogenophaga intermedia]
MFANSNDYLTGRKPVIFPAGSDLVAVRFALQLPLADLALNDCGAIGILPAGCVPVDVLVDADDLDTGAAALVLQVGVLNAAEDNLSTDADDGGAHWGATAAANAAFQQRLAPNGKAMVNVKPKNVDRKIGLKVATAPTAAQAGEVGVTLIYRAA